MGRAGKAVVRLLGGPAARLASYATRQRLRVVAYHGVPSRAAFEAQLDVFAARYVLVSEAAVRRALRREAALPPGAMWLTFDDGYETVSSHAQPVLDARGISATVFVCPWAIETPAPYWWETIEAAIRHRVVDWSRSEVGDALGHLKRAPDDARRAAVAEAVAALEHTGIMPSPEPRMTVEQLRRWLAGGHSIGNHTWDHPLLDRCRHEEQDRQVRDAHGWIERTLGVVPRSFAYPNGNWAAGVDAALSNLGYEVALGFDHQLARVRRTGPPHHLSRLRLDSDATVPRARAIASGLHPAGLHLRDHLVRRGANVVDPRRLPA